jgi:hypothetical protein
MTRGPLGVGSWRPRGLRRSSPWVVRRLTVMDATPTGEVWARAHAPVRCGPGTRRSSSCRICSPSGARGRRRPAPASVRPELGRSARGCGFGDRCALAGVLLPVAAVAAAAGVAVHWHPALGGGLGAAVHRTQGPHRVLGQGVVAGGERAHAREHRSAHPGGGDPVPDLRWRSCVESHDMDTHWCGAPCYRSGWRDSCAAAHHGWRRGHTQ